MPIDNLYITGKLEKRKATNRIQPKTVQLGYHRSRKPTTKRRPHKNYGRPKSSKKKKYFPFRL